jgi:hypothetical protein
LAAWLGGKPIAPSDRGKVFDFRIAEISDCDMAPDAKTAPGFDGDQLCVAAS